MIIQEAIERINDSIVEVISHFVDLKPHGRSQLGCCPFHNEKTASLTVTESKGIFKCFGCGKGGDAISFIMQHEKVEFIEALKIGAKKLNLQVDWKEDKEEYNTADFKHKESLRILCAKVAAYFQQCLRENANASTYVIDRNFEIDEADPFMLGYAPKGNTLLQWAKDNEINVSLLKEAGLISRNDEKGMDYDFFRERIMFPICSTTGKVIGFTGRIITDKTGVAKYMNTPDTVIFHKGKALFALNIARNAIRKEGRAYLVEGNFDVKRLHKIGVENTVAPCGTALTIDQVRLLKTFTKNVTLIYDGDKAGRAAIDRNGELLVKEQCNVMVMEIPEEQEGQDPDTLFTSLQTFEEFKSKHNTDYIYYKVLHGIEKCANPAFKSEFIKECSALICCYDDSNLHEVYMEQVSKMIRPAKAWADQIKSMVSEKAPVEKRRYIPEGISADELNERGFYWENNCYFFNDQKGIPHQRSNFVLTPLFHIESTINAKRLYEVKNIFGMTRVIEIPQRDLVSLSAFQIHVESLGNFWFDGSQSDLNRLKRYLYEKTESCKEITQLGWQKEGFWAWGNGIFNTDFIKVDEYGIVRNAKKSFYIPAFSSIFEKEENLYQFERKFIHREGNITLREYCQLFEKVFGDNAKVAICFYFAALFRDIITNRFGIFPILNMFGPKGAGKTACGESLVQFFGRLSKAPNVHNTSKAALGDHVATACNAIAHIDEYRNDVDMEKREFLKGLWDGVGRTRMNMDKDKKKETTSVDQAVIITGQQMATADIALFSRFVFLSFTQTEYTDEERNDFVQLKEIEKRGLTHLTHQILRFRAIFKDKFIENVEAVNKQMRVCMKREVVEDRIFNNWVIPLSAYCTLSDQLDLPWKNQDLIEMSVLLMIGQNKVSKTNDDLGNFWKVVQYMISSNVLFDGGDYKVVFTENVARRFFENGQWGKQDIKLGKVKQVFYLTISRVFSLYMSQSLRQGDKPLPESTVEHYLKNSPAFICETKKESFKKIDPKTGLQEKDDAGTLKRTSTTALVFQLDKIGLMLGTAEGENDPEGVLNSTAEGVLNFPLGKVDTELAF